MVANTSMRVTLDTSKFSCDMDLTLYQTTKIFDQSKLKELADNKINVTKKLKFVLGMAENVLGKGETSIFSFFPICF